MFIKLFKYRNYDYAYTIARMNTQLFLLLINAQFLCS